MSITLVITSCGRLDLLSKTIESLKSVDEFEFEEKIIIDDSGKRNVGKEIIKKYSSDFKIIINKKNIGQIRSIDKAYSEVKTKYIFHCEDDWFFYRSGFIKDSIEILSNHEEVVCVSFRDYEKDLAKHCPYEKITNMKIINNLGFCVSDKTNHGWAGFTFNPSVIRVGDYKDNGPYQSIGHELQISQFYLDKSKYLCFLNESAVSHIGWEQHIYNKHNYFDSRIKVYMPSKLLKLLVRIKRFIKSA
ncbi:glycosyltransferase family A protein [Vibrio sp. 10N.222.55.C7]|uniref:glycosyltransferase family A protein n=1 Tax=Vibrio sp. 10N.222.55.C7 TaxID=3229650 RepID=UPI0035516CA0